MRRADILDHFRRGFAGKGPAARNGCLRANTDLCRAALRDHAR
jgi:hypothetical protein